MLEAKQRGSSIVLMMGAHVIRSGVQEYLISMMEQGFISCIAVNGAVAIHDFELAMTGATTESVARYIRDGRFGMWKETADLNRIVEEAAKHQLGLGEAVGLAIQSNDFKFREISVLAAAYRLRIPVTVHVGIGYDIVYSHPNCNGGTWGQTSYKDFLIFAKVLERLQGGVVLTFGSAVMAPEVFLKALAMVRNSAQRIGEEVSDFTTLVCDMRPLPGDHHQEPPKSDPAYYFRPWKTMLVRTVADGGRSYYVQGQHDKTIPQLWTALVPSSS